MAADGLIDPRSHVARVALRVADVPRSVAFYGGLLGLEVEREDGESAALRSPGGGPVLVELVRAPAGGRAIQRASGLFHTALRWPSRAGLAGALVRVLRARQGLSGASDHGVSEALYLDDPDGNGVELYRDRPREQWPAPGAGERVAMFTAPLDLHALLDEAAEDDAGIDVGHVHLKVGELDEAERFWSEVVGLSIQQRFGAEASFLAAGDYHHHVGMNTWLSRGAPPEPRDRPGLERVVLAVPDDATLAAARERLERAGALTDGAGARFTAPGGIAGELVLSA